MDNNTQKQTYLGRMPMAAMQIRTALGYIYRSAQRLVPPEARDADPELDKSAAMLYHGYFRLLRLAKDMESMALLGRSDPLPTENMDLKIWMDEIVREATVLFDLKSVALHMVCSERYVITAANAHWLEQALWHLLSNALAACVPGGEVTAALQVQQSKVLLRVTDNGCGIPAERMDMLDTWHLRPMQPELLTGGLGVGLPLVRHIAQLHGGHFLLDSREDMGTTATIVLPLQRTSSVLNEPIMEYNGGFQRVMIELSDALPDEAFLVRHLDE